MTTRNTKLRAVRQETLREQLSNQKHIEHVVSLSDRIGDLDPSSDTFTNELKQIQAQIDAKFRLVNKYLPDLKSTEMTGEGGGDLTVKVISFANTDTE